MERIKTIYIQYALDFNFLKLENKKEALCI